MRVTAVFVVTLAPVALQLAGAGAAVSVTQLRELKVFVVYHVNHVSRKSRFVLAVGLLGRCVLVLLMAHKRFKVSVATSQVVDLPA